MQHQWTDRLVSSLQSYRNISCKFRGPSVTSVQLRDEFVALIHSIPGCICSAPHWIQRSDIYLPSAQCIFSKFCSPSNHLPNDFSSLLLLEEDCSVSCLLSLSNSEPEMGEGEEKEQHTLNIVFVAALLLHYLPLSKVWVASVVPCLLITLARGKFLNSRCAVYAGKLKIRHGSKPLFQIMFYSNQPGSDCPSNGS